MKKTFSQLVIIIGVLIAVAGLAAVVRLVNRSNSTTNRKARTNSLQVSVITLLQAHGGRGDRDWARFRQQGTLSYPIEASAGSQRRFERKLDLSTDGPVMRYDRATLYTNQSYLFDGNTLVRTTFQAGTQLDVKAVDGTEAASIKFQIATFGLLPILKRLADPTTQVIDVGATEKGNRFQVKTRGGSWYFYSNSNHLIDRLEIGQINITYGDYRTVAGLTLPFYQNVRKGETLLYELKFDTFELSPVFASGFFKT
ncbi:MAG TPA: hypothetical protein DC047_09900 [Blastocatellia bacterium]|nr:hypothetical protein [Blastocatellia bacterium]